jgi:monofunctional biosynthetic peptidoglycan transglycosylase
MARHGAVSRLLRRLLRWAVGMAAAGVLLSVLAVVALRWVDPPLTSFMLQARIQALFQPGHFQLRHEWRDIGQIAPHAAMAVVAAEDQRFPLHSGFDYESIRRAIGNNEGGGRVRGASTISQQVAKNLFLWPGRSWVRKGLEAWFTLLIEWLWPKQRILEVYLNTAEFGRGIYGVESAARVFFGKSATLLTPAEAALLAAVLPSPRRYRVDQPGPYVLARRQQILGEIHALGGAAWLRDVLPR